MVNALDSINGDLAADIAVDVCKHRLETNKNELMASIDETLDSYFKTIDGLHDGFNTQRFNDTLRDKLIEAIDHWITLKERS